MEALIAIGATVSSGAAAAGASLAGASSSLGAALGFGSAAGGAGAVTGLHAGAAGLAANAGIGAAAGGSSGVLSLLSGASSALGAFSTFAGALSQKRQADQAAYDAGIAARQEDIIGLQEGNDILDQAVDTLARQRVTIGASGVSAFSGTAENVMREGTRDTERAVRLSGNNAAIRSIRRRRYASAQRAQGRGAIAAGVLSAGAQALDGAARLKRIG